jgi:hypothetical protein
MFLVRPSGHRAGDGYADGGGVVAVAGVVHLRAVGEHGEDIAFGPQRHMASRLECCGSDAGPAIFKDGNAHEPVYVGHNRRAAETEALQDRLEICVAGLRGVNAVAQEVVGIAATAIDGVVPAHRIFNHRHQGGTTIGIEHAACAHEDIALDLYRVGGAVAILRIGPVVAEEINGLLAFKIDDGENIAPRNAGAPRLPGRNDFIKNDFTFFHEFSWREP